MNSFGIVPPKNRTPENWNNDANVLVGKIIPYNHIAKNFMDDDWVLITDGPAPYDLDDIYFLDGISVHRKCIYDIKNCDCKEISTTGCKCGGIDSEREYINQVRSAIGSAGAF